MRLFVWRHDWLIERWNRDDGSLARYGASVGDLRIMRLRPFPEPARRTTHRDTHAWHPLLNLETNIWGRFQSVLNQFLQLADKILGTSLANWHPLERSVMIFSLN